MLVQQALMVNDELIRCAILWHEQWHEGLENASKLYFQDKNPEEMLNMLRPLHAQLENGFSTLKEQSFNQALLAATTGLISTSTIIFDQSSIITLQTYYKELQEAYEHCQAYQRTGNPQEITTAWNLYYGREEYSHRLKQCRLIF